MKLDKGTHILLSLEIGSLFVLGLLALLGEPSQIVHADPGTLFASTLGTGTDCTQSSPCVLQTAVNQASDGDTLFVAGGIYTSTDYRVLMIEKSITIYGGWNGAADGEVVRDPTAYPTTLDGEGQRRVVRIQGNISPTLDGFLITNGRASLAGGVLIDQSSYPDAAPIVRNCVVTNNVDHASWGGGIYLAGGRPLIEHCRIVSNSTRYQGGGVAAASGSRLTLRNNLIAGNFAQFDHGAGIRLRDAWATLVNNTVADNTGAHGEGIYAENTTITLTNNIIVSNTYGLYGDNITATISYNNVWGNATANYAGLSDPTGSNGNISLNPLFVSVLDGDYFLSQVAAGQGANSSCVDAGSDSAVNLALDNYTTRTDGEVDSGTVDMGYHYSEVMKKAYLPLVLRDG